jgi:hypothetical protein
MGSDLPQYEKLTGVDAPHSEVSALLIQALHRAIYELIEAKKEVTKCIFFIISHS